MGLNFEGVEEWKEIDDHVDKESENVSEVNIVVVPRSRYEENAVKEAKGAELSNWKQFEVYSEVDDVGQDRISARWVITEKRVDDKPVIKARLVARGFEESSGVPVDSPTAAKDTIRIFFALTSTKGWDCKTIDIKAAFLQGKELDRDVFLIPPVEANACLLYTSPSPRD